MVSTALHRRSGLRGTFLSDSSDVVKKWEEPGASLPSDLHTGSFRGCHYMNFFSDSDFVPLTFLLFLGCSSDKEGGVAMARSFLPSPDRGRALNDNRACPWSCEPKVLAAPGKLAGCQCPPPIDLQHYLALSSAVQHYPAASRTSRSGREQASARQPEFAPPSLRWSTSSFCGASDWPNWQLPCSRGVSA